MLTPEKRQAIVRRGALSLDGIAARLRQMADEMTDLAADLDYFGGFSEVSKAGRELAYIGGQVHQVASEIQAENTTN